MVIERCYSNGCEDVNPVQILTRLKKLVKLYKALKRRNSFKVYYFCYVVLIVAIWFETELIKLNWRLYYYR